LYMMTLQERMEYINNKKKLRMDPSVAPNNLKQQTEQWIEEESDYDNTSDGEDDGEDEVNDDSNEY